MRPSSDAEALATNVECPTCGMAPQHTCVVEDGLGTATTRPHLHRVIEALRSALHAAEKERDELGAALDSALRTTDYGKDKLVMVMQRRYGREARQWQANHDQRKEERDVLATQFGAAQAAIAAECIEHVDLSGHIEVAEQCRDYLSHEAMDNGDPSGKLRDFAGALHIIIDQCDRQRRRANWYEAAHTAGKQKLIECAVDRALSGARAAAQVYVERVDALGLAADDYDPRVMATAEPIGAAQADLYAALGLLERSESGEISIKPPAETVEQLRAERDTAKVLADVRGSERDTLAAQFDAVQREADRWRHGVTVEGDYVCPAEIERDTLAAEVEQARHALFDQGYCGDGNLAAMITRALGEAKAVGRAEHIEISNALTAASDAFPPDMEGTIAERVGVLRAEVGQWKLALDELLAQTRVNSPVTGSSDNLADVMRRRYGREARQWQANHDQRKTERDAALARVRELEVQVARHSVLVERAVAPRLTKENDALSKVYGVAACLRTFPVPFDDHMALIDAVDACRQALHDLAFQEDPSRQQLECPHCRAEEPSVWDDILFHYAHPAEGGKLKMCHSPWRERCRRCSADVVSGPLCAACKEAS